MRYINGERLLCRELAKEEKKGMLILPDKVPSEVILEVMLTNEETPKFIKRGDRVLVMAPWMRKIDLEGFNYVIIDLEHVLGVV